MTATDTRVGPVATAADVTHVPAVRVRARARPRRPPAPPPPMPERVAVAFSAMLIVAAICGWFLFQLLALGGLQQARAQQALYDELREQLAAQTAPTGGAIEPGAPVALLSVPTLGLEQVVVEGTASGDLLAGPGHRRDTVLPGQVGVSTIYGRATTYGGPFRQITMLQAGDGIEVTTAQGEFVYRVDGVRRAGDPTPAVPGRGEARLTLVTAEGQGALAALTPDTLVYVDATLYGEPVAGPTGRSAAVPEAEQALAGDTSVLPVLALTMQGLVLATAAVVVLRRRLPGRVLWVIAAPVLVALAWLATDAAVQLLPNLL